MYKYRNRYKKITVKCDEEKYTNTAKMSLRLLLQSCTWTVTGLVSARPLGKLNLERTAENPDYLPSPSEAQQLLNQMKKENISRIFLNNFVSYNVHNETIEDLGK